MKKTHLLLVVIIGIIFVSCNNTTNNENTDSSDSSKNAYIDTSSIKIKEILDIYAVVELNVGLEYLSENDRKMLEQFILAAQYMDSIFYYQVLDNYKTIYNSIADEKAKRLFEINFGPWDRFDNDKSMLKNIEDKPLGANFYPADMTKEEFDKFNDPNKLNPYTFIRRNKQGKLYCVPYHEQLEYYISKISEIIANSTTFCEDNNFKKYLNARVRALQTDDYYESDTIWLNMENNIIDFVFGPIQISEDRLFSIKAEHQAYVLVKDEHWNKRMEKYNSWLPFFQKAIPVPEEYRKEEPGKNSKIYVYDVIFYGGSGNAGGTMIAFLQPLNHEIQVNKGVRNLQLKNAVNAKFHAISKPISKLIFVEDEQKYITSNAFLTNTILYEMANSLGIRNTINNEQSVREALKEYYSITNILKNRILSLFLVEKLHEAKEITNDIKDNYTTFVLNLIRLIRFGSSSDYAVANIICINFLTEKQAIIFNEDNTISIDYEKMHTASKELTKLIIMMQGDGNYENVAAFVNKNKNISDDLQAILDTINNNNIPKDIVFE